jgi:four helix bundle protein
MERRRYAFEKLYVWEDIRSMIKDIYKITASFPDQETYGLVIQIRRAAISIGSNLAEGSSRSSFKDQAHFYQFAYSSMMEVLSQLIVSHDLEFISENQYVKIREQIEVISFKLNALRKSALTKTS